MPKKDYYNDLSAPKANSIVPAVTAVVENGNGELLMIERADNGLWALPGGAQDFGESAIDAVRREVKEETGIDVEPIEAGSGVLFRRLTSERERPLGDPQGRRAHWSANRRAGARRRRRGTGRARRRRSPAINS